MEALKILEHSNKKTISSRYFFDLGL